MIKNLLLLTVFALAVSPLYGQDTMYYVQPAPVIVSVPAPIVSVVPVLVQKNIVVNTWEFRPIVTHNFVNVQYYYQPAPVVYPRRCWTAPYGGYYTSSSLINPYRY